MTNSRIKLTIRGLIVGTCSSFVLLTIILGIIYPLAVFTIGNSLFNDKAHGSLIYENNQVVGSALIGQSFEGDNRYFQSRISANNYDGLKSGGRNYSINNPKLLTSLDQKEQELKAKYGNAPFAQDMLTASASGLDPNISLENALRQIPYIAANTNISQEELTNLVNSCTQSHSIFNSYKVVNVLQLNLKLKKLLK